MIQNSRNRDLGLGFQETQGGDLGLHLISIILGLIRGIPLNA